MGASCARARDQSHPIAEGPQNGGPVVTLELLEEPKPLRDARIVCEAGDMTSGMGHPVGPSSMTGEATVDAVASAWTEALDG